MSTKYPTLHFANLHPDTTKKDLAAHIAAHGFAVSKVDVLYRHKITGELLERCVSNTWLEKPEDAQAAIAALNHTRLLGQKIFVHEYVPRNKRPVRTARVSFHKPAPQMWQAHIEGRSSEFLMEAGAQ